MIVSNPPAESLSLSNVTLLRPQKLVFEDINFSLASGGICLIKGPNGAGKTSLLRIIAGFLKAHTGVLKFGPKYFDPLKSTMPIWYVGSPFGFHPSLTAEKNLSQIASMRKSQLPVEDIFFTRNFAKQPVRTLSSGQLQRLALSQLTLESKSTTPALWLLDEPKNALDSFYSLALENVMEDHLRSGGRIIVATHQPICEHLSPQIVQLGIN